MATETGELSPADLVRLHEEVLGLAVLAKGSFDTEIKRLSKLIKESDKILAIAGTLAAADAIHVAADVAAVESKKVSDKRVNEAAGRMADADAKMIDALNTQSEANRALKAAEAKLAEVDDSVEVASNRADGIIAAANKRAVGLDAREERIKEIEKALRDETKKVAKQQGLLTSRLKALEHIN